MSTWPTRARHAVAPAEFATGHVPAAVQPEAQHDEIPRAGVQAAQQVADLLPVGGAFLRSVGGGNDERQVVRRHGLLAPTDGQAALEPLPDDQMGQRVLNFVPRVGSKAAVTRHSAASAS